MLRFKSFCLPLMCVCVYMHVSVSYRISYQNYYAVSVTLRIKSFSYLSSVSSVSIYIQQKQEFCCISEVGDLWIFSTITSDSVLLNGMMFWTNVSSCTFLFSTLSFLVAQFFTHLIKRHFLRKGLKGLSCTFGLILSLQPQCTQMCTFIIFPCIFLQICSQSFPYHQSDHRI